MNRSDHRPPTPPSVSSLEVFCRGVMVGTGLLLLVSAGVIVIGSFFGTAEGLLGVLFSDEFSLAWISLASFAHLAFVPAFCVVVATRDARRRQAGIPVPQPTSKWKGYDSVFLNKEAA